MHKANHRRAAILDAIEARTGEVAERMAAATLGEVPQYGGVRDPRFGAEVLAHSADHVRAFLRSARRGRPPAGPELDFVRSRGAARAGELFSIDALIQAYHLGQRSVWEAIVDEAGDDIAGLEAALDLTAATFAYTQAITTALVDAYVHARESVLAEADRVKRDLLDALLGGGALPAGAARQAASFGIERDTELTVLVAAVDADSGDALRAAADALQGHVDRGGLVVPRHEEAVAVLPLAGGGVEALRASVERAARQLRRTRGVALAAGLSTPCAGLDEVARGYDEARTALAHAVAGADGRVALVLAEVPLFDYLTDVAAEHPAAARIVPDRVRRLLEEDEARGGPLVATLRAYADAGLNVAATAAALFVHPNTVHYRLRKVHAATGLDPRRFAGLVELLAAARMPRP